MKITVSNYKEALKGISVIEVSGESCANCLTLMPILDRLISQRDDCVLHHLEVGDETMELVEKFEIEAVPTILVMNNDQVYVKCRGYQPEEILELWLDSKISELKAQTSL